MGSATSKRNNLSSWGSSLTIAREITKMTTQGQVKVKTLPITQKMQMAWETQGKKGAQEPIKNIKWTRYLHQIKQKILCQTIQLPKMTLSTFQCALLSSKTSWSATRSTRLIDASTIRWCLTIRIGRTRWTPSCSLWCPWFPRSIFTRSSWTISNCTRFKTLKLRRTPRSTIRRAMTTRAIFKLAHHTWLDSQCIFRWGIVMISDLVVTRCVAETRTLTGGPIKLSQFNSIHKKTWAVLPDRRDNNIARRVDPTFRLTNPEEWVR